MARIERRAEAFPDLPIDAPDTSGLDPRDAGLVRAIDSAVTRRWLTLTTVLQSRLDRPWRNVEFGIQSTLLVGTAQLLLFDRIPDHAAVDESVNHAKRVRGAKAGGFVNAVLRKVIALRAEIVPSQAEAFAKARNLVPLADGRAWRLHEDVFADDTVERLAQVGSVGRELLTHWISAHGFRAAVDLVRHGLVDPPLVVAGVPESLASTSDFAPHDAQGSHVFLGDLASLLAHLEANPSMRVQDAASGDPVSLTRDAVREPKVILDLCAGRGTKSVQLAAAYPMATVVATDVDDARRGDLAIAARRAPNITVIAPGAISSYYQRADLVVVDAPCSNTAVLPRRPEAAYRFTSRRLSQLVSTQRSIIQGAMPLLAPGGFLLYATCSLEPAENVRQCEDARRRHRLAPVAERQRFPQGLPGEPSSRYADGGFWSLMRRP